MLLSITDKCNSLLLHCVSKRNGKTGNNRLFEQQPQSFESVAENKINHGTLDGMDNTSKYIIHGHAIRIRIFRLSRRLILDSIHEARS